MKCIAAILRVVQENGKSTKFDTSLCSNRCTPNRPSITTTFPVIIGIDFMRFLDGKLGEGSEERRGLH